MKNRTLLFASLFSAATLTGCASTSLMPNATQTTPTVAAVQQAPVAVAQMTYKKPERIKIAGIGYGAESTFSAYTPGQRRLMAIRASKLDAYRALAEQLYGVKIDSNTAISTLTAKNDSFRARVNAVVRGARVVSVTPMADNNYETVLEVYVDQRFFDDTFVYSSAGEQGVLTPAEVCVQCRDASSY